MGPRRAPVPSRAARRGARRLRLSAATRTGGDRYPARARSPANAEGIEVDEPEKFERCKPDNKNFELFNKRTSERRSKTVREAVPRRSGDRHSLVCLLKSSKFLFTG